MPKFEIVNAYEFIVDVQGCVEPLIEQELNYTPYFQHEYNYFPYQHPHHK
jgi:hypothetical protein